MLAAITAHLSVCVCVCVCVCGQVNLLPGLMEAFSDSGGRLCRLYAQSQLTGESAPGEGSVTPTSIFFLKLIDQKLF